MPWTLLVLAMLIDILTWLPDFDEMGVAVILDMAKAAMAEDGVADDWLELEPVDGDVGVPEDDDDEVDDVVEEVVVAADAM